MHHCAVHPWTLDEDLHSQYLYVRWVLWHVVLSKLIPCTVTTALLCSSELDGMTRIGMTRIGMMRIGMMRIRTTEWVKMSMRSEGLFNLSDPLNQVYGLSGHA